MAVTLLLASRLARLLAGSRHVCFSSILVGGLALAGCAGGGDEPQTGGPAGPDGAAQTVSVSGAISGLGAGKVVVVGNTGANGDVLQKVDMAANGSYTLKVAAGSMYNVRVVAQPEGQICRVSRGSGTALVAVSDVDVACTNNASGVSVGGTVSGLGNGKTLVLRRDGAAAGEELSVDTNGAFTFTRPVSGAYTVSVRTQPQAQQCNVFDGIGVAAAGNVTNISVRCIPTVDTTPGAGAGAAGTYRVGGTIEGLPSGRVFAIFNNGSTLSLDVNGSFAFDQRFPQGAVYNVTMATPPDGPFSCVINNGQGTIGTADVTNVRIVCSSTQGLVGAKVRGLRANVRMELQSTGAGDLQADANGDFTFPQPVSAGTSVAVSLKFQPDDLANCTVSGSPVTVQANTTVYVNVTCEAIPQTFSVGGTVTGTNSANLVTIRDTVTGETLTLGNGAFTFPQRRQPNTSYNVQIVTGPKCEVRKGTGTVQSPVSDIAVVCAA